MQMSRDEVPSALDVFAADRDGRHRAILLTVMGVLATGQNATVSVAARQLPIRLVLRDDDLRRRRLTVFFRLLLVIPAVVWLFLWGIAAFVVAFILWVAVLIEGKTPRDLHNFVAGYVRYSTHVGAYVFLAANPYPGFRGSTSYPVDLEIAPPARQNRWTAGFRLVLALPALLLAAALGGDLDSGSWQFGSSGDFGHSRGAGFWFGSMGVAAAAAFLGWFVSLSRGRMARGLRDVVAYALGYAAQTAGYFLLLTDRYPNTDPALAETYARLPVHPVRMVVTDELERSRLTVFFRLFLAIPHLFWLALWAVAALFAAVAAWFAALVTGYVPRALHRFLAAFLRYGTHLYAYLTIVGRRFPGFTGREGSYGIDLLIDAPVRQSRWKTLFRLFLSVPALILNGALGGVLLIVAFLGWWYALFKGRMPEGLRNLGASCLRYGAQTNAYLFLLTERYPYASPVLEERIEPEIAPIGVVPGDVF